MFCVQVYGGYIESIDEKTEVAVVRFWDYDDVQVRACMQEIIAGHVVYFFPFFLFSSS